MIYSHKHPSHSFAKHFLKDILIIIASVAVAVLLVKLGVIGSFAGDSTISLILASFLSGALFTSLLTLAPAGVSLVALAESFNPFAVAFFGSLGAMLVDLAIIRFVRKEISSDIDGLARMAFRRHIIRAFHFGFLKWIAFGAGVLLIASPLPDELGLFFIGISKINPRFLPLVFLSANFLGILLIIAIASAI